MIWLSLTSLAVGALLAQRFRIIVLVPATFTEVVAAIGAGVAQTNGTWSTVLVFTAVSVSTQAGYFMGILIQRNWRALLASSPSSFPHTTSARDPLNLSGSDF